MIIDGEEVDWDLDEPLELFNRHIVAPDGLTIPANSHLLGCTIYYGGDVIRFGPDTDTHSYTVVEYCSLHRLDGQHGGLRFELPDRTDELQRAIDEAGKRSGCVYFPSTAELNRPHDPSRVL